ncbi:MAG TPA: hypothetical protein VIQ30_05925 [Pseudonocardia sp.]
MIRIWDRDFHLLHTLDEAIVAEYAGEWRKFTVPADHPAARWLVENHGTTAHFTIDNDGQRWHGVVNQWERKRHPCPDCQGASGHSLIVYLEPSVVVPARVMDYRPNGNGLVSQ